MKSRHYSTVNQSINLSINSYCQAYIKLNSTGDNTAYEISVNPKKSSIGTLKK